jgi:hypothetical protein
MTTVLNIKDAVGSLTGDVDLAMFTATDVLRYLNWGQAEICRDFKMLETVLVGNPTVLSNFEVIGGVLLPADFVVEINVAMGIGGPLTRLQRIPLASWWGQQTLTPTAAQPTCYSISDYQTGSQAQQRHLIPYPPVTPGTSALYRVNYQNRPAALVSDSDVLITPVIFDELLATYIVRLCKLQENDLTGAEYFKRMYEERKKNMLSEFNDHSELEFFRVRDEVDPVYSQGW